MTDSPADPAALWARFFELFEQLPRGGPGDPESARRALRLMTGLPGDPRIIDLGCGPGRSSVELARLTGGRVTAFDLHAPFVAGQAAVARREGLARCIDPVCGDMGAAPFRAGAFDLVWSEGALYSIGFRQGLDACLRLVKAGGYVAATEAVWIVPDPPGEIRQWWESEYPAIASIEATTAVVTGAGLDLVAHFTLPPSAWGDEYYGPIRAGLEDARRRWAGDGPGREVVARLEEEIRMFDRWGHTYGYEFFVARRPPN